MAGGRWRQWGHWQRPKGRRGMGRKWMQRPCAVRLLRRRSGGPATPAGGRCGGVRCPGSGDISDDGESRLGVGPGAGSQGQLVSAVSRLVGA